MERNNCCGLKFDCNYDAGYADIKNTNCVSNALYSFQHIPPSQPKYPHMLTKQSVMERNYSMTKVLTYQHILTGKK